MTQIAIILNPHSKLNKRNPKIREDFSRILEKNQGELKVTDSLDILDKTIEELKNKKIPVIGIHGGDGTISQTLSRIIHTFQGAPLPKILILKGGTMNVLCDNLGIKDSAEETLKKFVQNPELPVYPIKALEVSGTYGFLFASGTCARFLNLFYLNKTNALGAAILAAKTYLSAIVGGSLAKSIIKRDEIVLKTSMDSEFSHKSLTVLCSTLLKLPMGFNYFTLLKNENLGQKLQISSVTYKEQEIQFKLARLLMRASASGANPGEFTTMCERAKISSKTPICYTVDGEMFETLDPIEIKLGPEIKFLLAV